MFFLFFDLFFENDTLFVSWKSNMLPRFLMLEINGNPEIFLSRKKFIGNFLI